MALIVVYLTVVGNYFTTLDPMKRDNHSRFTEIYEGVKQHNKSRFYSLGLLSRRLIFVTLLIFNKNLSVVVIISIMVGVDIAYILFLVLTRPFEQKSNNLIEILNEVYFFVLLSLLLHFNLLSRWSKVVQNAYIYLILTNSLIVALISVGK